jgi:hypothetical protein
LIDSECSRLLGVWSFCTRDPAWAEVLAWQLPG